LVMFVVGVTTDVASPLNHKYRLAELGCDSFGKRAAGKPGAYDEPIYFHERLKIGLQEVCDREVPGEDAVQRFYEAPRAWATICLTFARVALTLMPGLPIATSRYLIQTRNNHKSSVSACA